MDALKWIIFNGLFALAAYAGMVMENPYAMNVLTFAIFIIFFMATIMVASVISDHKSEEKEAKERLGRLKIRCSVPKWVDASFDIVFTAFMAAYGEFALATVYLLANVFMWVIQDIAKEHQEKTTA